MNGHRSALFVAAGLLGLLLVSCGNGALLRAFFIAAGGNHACAGLEDFSTKCWGLNTTGQLGQGDTENRGDQAGEMGNNLSPIDLGLGRFAVALAAGGGFTCAVLDDHTTKCWGDNQFGELGQGDTVSRGDGATEMGANLLAIDLGAGRTAVALAAGLQFACALLDNATVKCWGKNDVGQLGQGDTAARGDGATEMGNNLLAIDLGTGRTAAALAAGQSFVCALLDDATVKCWGDNSAGQLGQGDTATRGDGAAEMGDNLLAIDLGGVHTAVAIAAGNLHACAVLDDATVKCWGDNSAGQLGQGDTAARGDGAAEMGNNLLTIDLGTGRTAVALTAGVSETCALLDNATVKCWGANGNGELGQGDITTRGDGPGEMGDALPAISLGLDRTAVAIASGGNDTCALLDDGMVKCWGKNDVGQLGQGDTAARGDGAAEMGDNLSAINLGAF